MSSGRWKFFGDRSRRVLLVVPFLLGALALRFAIAPLGDAIASGAVRALPEPTRAPPLLAAPSAELAAPSADVAGLPSAPVPDDEPSEPALPRRVAARTPAPRRETIDDARDGGIIVVPAAAVTRALERRDVRASNATAADGAPLGARLAGVGKYKTGLRDGDVVVTVGGTRTPTVDAMVSAAMAVATSGASRISGRILRGDATVAVVLELPKQ